MPLINFNLSHNLLQNQKVTPLAFFLTILKTFHFLGTFIVEIHHSFLKFLSQNSQNIE
jgi:hypothetical protein